MGQRYVYVTTIGNHEDSLASRQDACQARVDFRDIASVLHNASTSRRIFGKFRICAPICAKQVNCVLLLLAAAAVTTFRKSSSLLS